ncbi:aromatic ring-hydroxylating oxygenase subunit alpha [Chamaesiphon polymorphus]|uniref:Aromatic ring-hydroxylating dioxygenase subunit alpha n=1 Tax=Chamaesiphon polymorphus CCALA 037 TaxID=2107692 RepID=A0A2T1GB08_9CYAN|nr:aromatic ring-hydroxylating dioxygenase subunit alpha [Chamaesiphon polymorphus]PSB54474.1 aromatic ring-hydroxylating dioxygenase subunit alpha [Chamaesiphon polymorphus CCALA 037]
MSKNLWYAVEFCNAIGTSPKLIKILDREIVLYRTADGRIQAIDNNCIHRGAALANGWLENDCIVCPYHGWQYRTDGTCSKIPSQAATATIPKSAKMTVYPVGEKYGWIWLFLSDGAAEEIPTLPNFPQLESGTIRSIQGEFHWNANYERVLENGLDFAHAPFVHAGAFGNPDRPEIEDLQIENYPDGASATVYLAAIPPKGLWKFLVRGERAPIKTRTGFFLPNLTFLEVYLPFGQLTIWTAHVPIDLHTTVSKWINFRSFFTGKWADGDAYKRTIKIFEQDQPIVESQRPQIIPTDVNAELYVAADVLQLQYRKLRQPSI